jgi:hypothetical protein
VYWQWTPGPISEFVDFGACSVKAFVTVFVEYTENVVVAAGLLCALLRIINNTDGGRTLCFVRDHHLRSGQAEVTAGGLKIHLLSFALAHDESDRAGRALSLSSLKGLPAP